MALFPQKFEVILHFLFEHLLNNKQTLPLGASRMKSVDLEQLTLQKSMDQHQKLLEVVKRSVQKLLVSPSTLKAILKEK